MRTSGGVADGGGKGGGVAIPVIPVKVETGNPHRSCWLPRCRGGFGMVVHLLWSTNIDFLVFSFGISLRLQDLHEEDSWVNVKLIKLV